MICKSMKELFFFNYQKDIKRGIDQEIVKELVGDEFILVLQLLRLLLLMEIVVEYEELCNAQITLLDVVLRMSSTPYPIPNRLRSWRSSHTHI